MVNGKELYYMVNRWYDPELGRFTQVDPIGIFNESTYAGNNPMIFVDQLGLDKCRWFSPWNCPTPGVTIFVDPDSLLGKIMGPGLTFSNFNFVDAGLQPPAYRDCMVRHEQIHNTQMNLWFGGDPFAFTVGWLLANIAGDEHNVFENQAEAATGCG